MISQRKIEKAACRGCNEPKSPDELKRGRCLDCWRKHGARARRKGKTNERANDKEWRKKFPHIQFQRTPMSGALGIHFPGDRMAWAPHWSIFNRIYFEDKKEESWAVREWMTEAVGKSGQAGRDLILIDASRNNEDHYIICPMETFLKIAEEAGEKKWQAKIEHKQKDRGTTWPDRRKAIEEKPNLVIFCQPAGMPAVAIARREIVFDLLAIVERRRAEENA